MNQEQLKFFGKLRMKKKRKKRGNICIITRCRVEWTFASMQAS